MKEIIEKTKDIRIKSDEMDSLIQEFINKIEICSLNDHILAACVLFLKKSNTNKTRGIYEYLMKCLNRAREDEELFVDYVSLAAYAFNKNNNSEMIQNIKIECYAHILVIFLAIKMNSNAIDQNRIINRNLFLILLDLNQEQQKELKILIDCKYALENSKYWIKYKEIEDSI